MWNFHIHCKLKLTSCFQRMHLTPHTTHILRQFLTFCLVGIFNTAVDIGIYYILTRGLWTFHDSFSVYKAISYLLATACSFALNRYLTFARRDAVKTAEVVKFYSTVGLGIFLNVGVQYLGVVVFGIHDLAAALLAVGATAIWGFSFSRFYVFNDKE